MNEQEKFWRGSFGDEYTKRNRVSVEQRVPFWRRIIENTRARSVLDVGTNAGWNLLALRHIDPSIRLVGIDVNATAVAEARSHGLDVRHTSIDAGLEECFDLVCTSGVLIHVAKADLTNTMEKVITASRLWVLAVEYWAPRDEEVQYRGHGDRLWKRPYGKIYRDLGLFDADGGGRDADGFDNCQWWLMMKDVRGMTHKGVNGLLPHTEI